MTERRFTDKPDLDPTAVRSLPAHHPAMVEAYRMAVEAFNLAADLGCSGDLYDALAALCEREAKTYEASQEGRTC